MHDFDNRMGDDARVFLGSSELAAMSVLNGVLPTPEEHIRFIEAKTAQDS